MNLNSNRYKYTRVTFENITIPANGYITYSNMQKADGAPDVPQNIILAAISSYGIVDPKGAFTAGAAYLIGTAGMTLTRITITFIHL